MKKCVHNEDYRCKICGECLPCAHAQSEIEEMTDECVREMIYWRCRFTDDHHRTTSWGDVIRPKEGN